MKQTLLIICSALLLLSCGPRSTVHQVNDNNKTASRKPTHVINKGEKDMCSIPMRRENGVCYVMVKLNGVDMEVIFDTGASDVVISSVEAMFLLKQGKLTENDILGTSYYQVANGAISSGTIINLNTVQIGNKLLTNVRATVVDNMEAPLLLGQSALENFSSVSIDYTNNVIRIK